MKVIILSAGKGTRMFPLTQNTPKCLLELGNGLTVLESQLDSIQKAGLTDIVLITGYLTEQVEAKIKPYQGQLNIQVRYNPFFDVSNNLVSLWMALRDMDDDFIVLNGDDVFHPDVVTGLLTRDDNLCMVIDKKSAYSEDDMKVTLKGDQLVRVGKKISLDETHGESIGMIQFRRQGCPLFQRTLEHMVRDPLNHQVFYLEAVQRLADQGHVIMTHEIREDQWAEIDFHPDLSLIKNNLGRYSHVLTPVAEK